MSTHAPATFAERGLSAPFTAPTLNGARLRVSTGKGGVAPTLDALVPSPSRGRGMYIVPWPNVRELFRPTLHDTRLGEGVADFVRTGAALSPAATRRIARGVASDGLAGRPAAAAATAAAKDAKALRMRALLGLQQAMASELGIPGKPGPDAIVAAAATASGRSAAAVAGAMDRMADPLAELGLFTGDRPGFTARLLDRVRALSVAAASWGASHDGPAAATVAYLQRQAKLAALLGHRALDLTRQRTANLLQLVVDMTDNPTAAMQALERPAWLLDGWDRVCSLGDEMPASSNPGMGMLEMSAVLPVLPPETEDWLDLPARPPGQVPNWVQGNGWNPDAPDADPSGLIARNERLRAVSA